LKQVDKEGNGKLKMQQKLQIWWQSRPECEAYLNESRESIEAAAWQLQAQNRLLSWAHKAALATLFILQHEPVNPEWDLRRMREQALAWPVNK